MKVLAVMVALIALLAVFGAAGCGAEGALPATSTTAGPGGQGTVAPDTLSTFGAGPNVTDITLAPPPAGSDQTLPPDANRPTTTVNTGTTLQAGDQQIALTFVGPMTADTWNALRTAVNHAGGDGDKVRSLVAKLSAGPDAEVTMAEIDRFSGIGFTAGANVSQPVAVADDADRRPVLVYAFTVTGKPATTTIVGFDRETGHVGLVEGPLKISDSTRNVTTVPGQ